MTDDSQGRSTGTLIVVFAHVPLWPVYEPWDIPVSAKNFMFDPVSIAVKAGTTVTWVNLDDEPHTVFSDAGLFRSSALATQEHFSFKFETAGTYHYRCTIHPRMLGTIIVE
jgi:plastocyanin